MIATIGDNISSLRNTTISIKCPTVGIPKPVVSWRKAGQVLILNERVAVDDEGTLTFISTKVEDRGLYTCVVKNRGAEESASSQINVVGQPMFSSLLSWYHFTYQSS